MTEDLDVVLRRRLALLADAVPVQTAQPTITSIARAPVRSKLLRPSTGVPIVAAVALIALMFGLRGPAAPNGGAGPSGSPESTATATYPDGLPMSVAGEHVYRPGDTAVVGGGQVLVGGWVVGWIVSACVPQLPAASPPGCPESAQLAEAPNGPTVLIVRWPSGASHTGPGVVLRVTATDVGCGDGGGSCVAPTVVASAVLWSSTSASSQPSLTAPSPVPSAIGLRLPNPGGTCLASQFHLGQATLYGEPSTWGGAHVGIDQPLRNDGLKCVLALPKVIGLAPAEGSFVAATIGNLGVTVYTNGVGKTVYPTSFTIPAGGSLKIIFNAYWQVETLSGSPAPADCANPLSGISRAEFPLASGWIAINWVTPVDEVCAPAQFSMTVENA